MTTPDRAAPGSTPVSRRRFLHRAIAAGGAVAVGPWLGARRAADVLRVGLVAPAADARSAGAARVVRGVELGASEAATTAALFGRGVELLSETVADATPAAHRAAGARLADAGVAVLVGGVDEAGCRALSTLASERGLVYLNVGSPSDAMRRAGCGATTFHVVASYAMRMDAVLAALRGELAATLRAEPPARWLVVTTEDAPPPYAVAARDAEVARRLGAAPLFGGATPLVAASVGELLARPVGRGEDVAFLQLAPSAVAAFVAAARPSGSAARLVDLTGTSADLAEPLPAGSSLAWPAEWDPSLERFGGAQLNDRYRARFGEAMDGHAWAGWAAVKIAADAALRARTAEAAALARALSSPTAQFDGHKGYPLSFRAWDRQLRQPLYVVRSLGAVAATAPGGGGRASSAAAELDLLGDDAATSACRGRDG